MDQIRSVNPSIGGSYQGIYSRSSPYSLCFKNGEYPESSQPLGHFGRASPKVFLFPAIHKENIRVSLLLFMVIEY